MVDRAKSKRKRSPWEQAQAAQRAAQERNARELARAAATHTLTRDQAAAVRYTREFVERARETARRDQETLDDYVLELRESYGLSWSQLAAALGTSAPGAAKRHAAALTRRDQQEHNR